MTDIKKKILDQQLSIIEKDIPLTFKRDILDALREAYYQVSLAESLVHEVEILNDVAND